MKLGDVARFPSDQAIGHHLREKIHIFVGKTTDHRASDEYAFLFISSGNHADCFPIEQCAYPGFLAYDSFISCGGMAFYSYEYLKTLNLRKLGALSDDCLSRLRDHLANHDIMETWQCNMACKAIDAALSARN
jgi:hypothetical protein